METYYDIHCHFFDENVLIKRLVSVILPLAELLEKEEKVIKNEDLINRLKNLRDTEKGLLKKLLELKQEPINEANYQQQISDLENLVSNYSNVKPFFSVDPRRQYIGN